MKINILFILVASWLAGNTLHAQTYTLEDCLRMTLENNRTLQSARMDADKAKKTKREAFTAYFPEISGVGGGFLLAHEPLPGLKNGVVAAVTAMQPLFAGGKIVNSNKLAGVQHEMTVLQYELTEENILQKCTELYWLIVSFQANIGTLEAADRQLAEMQRQTENYVKAGVRLPADTLRISLKRSELEGKRLTIDNALRLNLMSMASLIGADRANFSVADSAFSMPDDPMNHFCPAHMAVVRRPEYALSQKKIEASRYQLRMERGKRMPTLGIGVSGMYNYLMDKGETNALLFASLSVPISAWWGGSHALKKARLNLRQSELSLADCQEKLNIDIQHAWDSTVEAYKQIGIAQRALRSAEENLRINRSYYKNGTTDITDLLDAESLFISNQNNLTTAYATYQIRLADYLRKIK